MDRRWTLWPKSRSWLVIFLMVNVSGMVTSRLDGSWAALAFCFVGTVIYAHDLMLEDDKR